MEILQNNGPEERITSLENRLKEMDALVHGLLSELLDIKVVNTTMARQHEEYDRRDLLGGLRSSGTSVSPSSASAVSSTGTTIIRPGKLSEPVVPAEPEMVRIMQSDGTMKMEPRHGENRIDSSAGYGRKKGFADSAKQSPLIYAADEKKDDVSKK
jgi:hypothetical protein